MLRTAGRFGAGAALLLGMGTPMLAIAQPAPPPAPPPSVPSPPASDRAAPQPDPWFSPEQGAAEQGPRPPDSRPQPDGAYVQLPTQESEPPPPPLPPDIPPYEGDTSREGALLMAMLAVRPFGTYVGAGDDSPDDPNSSAAGHVGFRAHANGITDDMIIRTDLEAFIGASSQGVEGEGRAFLSFGLAEDLGESNYIMFRLGAGGAVFGNPVVDYQAADLPALELGYVLVGGDRMIEVAPRIAMGVISMSAFQVASLEPNPAPAVGGRILAGGESLWGTVDYEIITGDHPLQLGALTACFADKLAVCLDGRVASASLGLGAALGNERVTAFSAGLSVGLGLAAIEE